MLFYLMFVMGFAALTVQAQYVQISKPLVNDPEVSLPKYFKPCPRNAEIDKCIEDSLKVIIPAVNKGIEELGFPAMDPYFTEKFSVDYNQNSIKGKMNLKNIRVNGGTDVEIVNVKSDITDNDLSLDMTLRNPFMNVEGIYKGTGKFNSIQIASKGSFNVSMFDVVTPYKIRGSIIDKNGEKYINITEFLMQPEVGDMNIYIDGLFPNNEEFSKVVADFANQYWRVIYSEMLPLVQPVWDEGMIDISNRIFLNIPFRRLFPKE